MRTGTLLVLTVIGVAGCRPSAPATRATTERERDSAIGASRLPGAQGVRGALRVSASADARRAREDSAAQE